MNVIITGGASGIGAGAARRLAKRMHVVIADRNIDGAKAFAAELVAAGHRASAVEVDVSNKASVLGMVEWMHKNVGDIDALFANAGFNRRAPVDEITQEDWDAMMATHVKGVFLCNQAVIPGMLARGKGAIVNTSSDFAVMGVANLGAYCAAKSAIYSLTKSIAQEFTPRGIRVNAIGPGPIDTPILRSGRSPEVFAEHEKVLTRLVPLGRLGTPDEVAVSVDFLLSDKARFISGQLIHPNGGQLMW
jgi:NAD(P)-dependent dehydrogenase (short-subunit alcohol dehydrogenase family)